MLTLPRLAIAAPLPPKSTPITSPAQLRSATRTHAPSLHSRPNPILGNGNLPLHPNFLINVHLVPLCRGRGRLATKLPQRFQRPLHALQTPNPRRLLFVHPIPQTPERQSRRMRTPRPVHTFGEQDGLFNLQRPPPSRPRRFAVMKGDPRRAGHAIGLPLPEGERGGGVGAV